MRLNRITGRLAQTVVITNLLVATFALADVTYQAGSIERIALRRIEEINAINTTNASWNAKQAQQVELITSLLAELAKDTTVLGKNGKIDKSQVKANISAKLAKLAELSGMENRAEIESLAAFRSILESIKGKKGEMDAVRAKTTGLLTVVEMLEKKYGLTGKKPTALPAQVEAYRGPRQGLPTLGTDKTVRFTPRETRYSSAEYAALAKTAKAARENPAVCPTPYHLNVERSKVHGEISEIQAKLRAENEMLRQLPGQKAIELAQLRQGVVTAKSNLERTRSELDRFRGSSEYAELKDDALRLRALLESAFDAKLASDEKTAFLRVSTAKRPAADDRSKAKELKAAKDRAFNEIAQALVEKHVDATQFRLKLSRANGSTEAFADALYRKFTDIDRDPSVPLRIDGKVTVPSNHLLAAMMQDSESTQLTLTLKDPEALERFFAELKENSALAKGWAESERLQDEYSRFSARHQYEISTEAKRQAEIEDRYEDRFTHSRMYTTPTLHLDMAQKKAQLDLLKRCEAERVSGTLSLMFAEQQASKAPAQSDAHLRSAVQHFEKSQKTQSEYSRRYLPVAPTFKSGRSK